MTVISGERFAAALASISSSAFRIEVHPSPALDVERADFDRFLTGNPTDPRDMAWYDPWINQVTEWANRGITVTRVRVLSEPPSDYQRWLLWAHTWFTSIGEHIRYLNRSVALDLGLPLTDWWLLDDKHVIEILFTPDGQVHRYDLITDPDNVAVYRNMRDKLLTIANPEPVTV